MENIRGSISREMAEQLKQKVESALYEVDKLVENELVDLAYRKYTKLIKWIESNKNQVDYQMISNVYSSFAYFLFRVSEYEEFFNMLIKAQEYGYSKDEIENMLYLAFIEPNLNEFKSNYESNTKLLFSNLFKKNTKDFNDLPYWLLPTGVQNEYFLYDKKQRLITEKISLQKIENQNFEPPSDTFADYLILVDCNLNSIISYTEKIKGINKKPYIVVSNFDKFLSLMQGSLLSPDEISNLLIFDSFDSMRDYFKSCSAYLPRLIIDLNGKSTDDAQKIIHEIHTHRIRNKVKKRDKVLLSIGIPSYNRGKRVYENVRHLLQTYFDEEIEIIVSNNGTENETKEYYDEIQDINDSRIKYFAFESNQGMAVNFCKVCELASGTYILLLSDEDLVNFDVLDKILTVLKESKDPLALFRTSTPSQGVPPSIKTEKAGKDALLTFMLTSNYMSGIILNNEMLKKYNGIQYIKENLDNSVCYYYPHMYWELLLSQYGDVKGTELVLINEGKAEKTEFSTTEIGNNEDKVKIPYYASIEGRLKQHEGFSSIFKELEICKKDVDISREMHLKLCTKTLFLVYLSINAYYKKTNVDGNELLKRAYEFCLNKEHYQINNKNNYFNYRNDVKIISNYYNYFNERLQE